MLTRSRNDRGRDRKRDRETIAVAMKPAPILCIWFLEAKGNHRGAAAPAGAVARLTGATALCDAGHRGLAERRERRVAPACPDAGKEGLAVAPADQPLSRRRVDEGSQAARRGREEPEIPLYVEELAIGPARDQRPATRLAQVVARIPGVPGRYVPATTALVVVLLLLRVTPSDRVTAHEHLLQRADVGGARAVHDDSHAGRSPRTRGGASTTRPLAEW